MVDHFERLGQPRRFSVDTAALEREYLARSRAVHPDFHQAGATADLAASMEASAALNQAYNTLRDPILRAEYLVTIYGGPTAQVARNQDPAFLGEMMDVRERIESARAGDGDVGEIRLDLEKREVDYPVRIAAYFDRYERAAADDPDRFKHLARIRQSLNELKTIRSLLRDLPEDDD